MSKRMSILVSLAVIALAIAGCGGGSSDHSSEGSDSQAASLESDLSAAALMTREQAECVVDRARSAFPTSVLDSMSDSQRAELEEIIGECGGDSSGSEATSDDLYGGPACLEELESAECISEVEEKTGAAVEQGEDRLQEEQDEDLEEFENEEGLYE